MKPVEFKGQNVVFGKDQPEYRDLPALKIEDPSGTVITCWELSEEELIEITKSKRIYLSQMTFRSALQPILPAASLDGLFG